MSNLSRMKWTELKADLQTVFREGIVALKKGAMVARKEWESCQKKGCVTIN